MHRIARIWLLTIFALFTLPALAQQAGEPPGFEERVAAMDGQIRALIEDAQEFRARAEENEGDFARILRRRSEDAGLAAIEKSHDLADLVIEHESQGGDVGQWRERATELLLGMQQGIEVYLERVLSRTDQDVSSEDPSPAAMAALEDRQAELWARILRLLGASRETVVVGRSLGLDMDADQIFTEQALTESVQFLSLSLEGAMEQIERIQRQLAVLPDDADLGAQQRLADLRVKRLARNLTTASDMLEEMELENARYKQQLIEVTGTVTTEIFDWEVFKGLVSGWIKDLGGWLAENLPVLLFKLILFLLVLWISFTVSRLTRRLVAKGLARSSLSISQLLMNMIVSTAGGVVLLLGVLFSLAQLGISVGPLLAGLGIAGFIIGFALQDTLGNFAAGMMILLYRPYDVGDTVEAGGVFGKVDHMSLVNTTILTFDNQTLVMPNSKIWGDVIKNVTAQQRRRVDMIFGIGYGDDIPKAEKVLTEIITRHDRVLDDPAPVVRLHTLGESSVDFIVRPWVQTEDYWDVYWDVTRAVKLRFDEAGISIPFPQRDIHVYGTGTPPLEGNSSSTGKEASMEQDPVGWRGNKGLDSPDSSSEDSETTD